METVKRLTAKDKDVLAEMVVSVYRVDPQRLRKALPEAAEYLNGLLAQPTGKGRDGSPFGLTERERKFHKDALESLLKNSRSLTSEEAVKGLEHGAVLLDDNSFRFEPMEPSRDELLKLVRRATGIRPRKKGKPVEKVVGEGDASRIIPVVRGINLHLTWDFKLLRVTLDPKEWELLCRALSFVGIGRDSATDVAERHDDYLIDAYRVGRQRSLPSL